MTRKLVAAGFAVAAFVTLSIAVSGAAFARGGGGGHGGGMSMRSGGEKLMGGGGFMNRAKFVGGSQFAGRRFATASTPSAGS